MQQENPESATAQSPEASVVSGGSGTNEAPSSKETPSVLGNPFDASKNATPIANSDVICRTAILSPVVIQVKNADMPQEMQEKAIELAKQTLLTPIGTLQQQPFSTRDVAGNIKREFDRLYGTSWHCIVGKVFGSHVTHEMNCFIFFYVGPWAIMLFKTI